MTERVRWATLPDAWRAFGWERDDLPTVTRITDSVGIDYFEPAGDRIAARRRDQGRVLHIHPGFTHGFPTEADAEAAVGDAPHLGVERHSDGLWRVLHLTFGYGGGGGAPRRPAADHGICENPDCSNFSIRLPSSGVCPECGWQPQD